MGNESSCGSASNMDGVVSGGDIDMHSYNSSSLSLGSAGKRKYLALSQDESLFTEPSLKRSTSATTSLSETGQQSGQWSKVNLNSSQVSSSAKLAAKVIPAIH